MPECPYCNQGFVDADLAPHILKEHPEKGMGFEAFGEQMRRAVASQTRAVLAASLTATSVGAAGAKVEEVLERFRYFLNALMQGGI